MSVKSIKLESGISDPDFMEINTNARKSERAHLLGLLRIFMSQLKKESLPPEEIYSSVDRWISNRELIINEDNKS
ncbi:TPA: hypothetical protein L2B28_001924 [Citrobacter freundii]|uniref:hypothetical protein n=1 Tax=Citrobacter freundii TaxID=546 RepID=UPI001BCDEA60|nr:hypothetical protein [Citrobacter freundii]EKU3681231.1 hypothetical protein [Citrobacter freundii]MDT7160472.1 hypothetical protein [Citrobacter freundii]MDX7390703.1 hypothetical protein [Citrobacter freundii]HBN2655562.1 hypothetical protein [Citrobacter freundii]HBN2666486.1 hypothetical protein [Citrobacter freundii]